MGPMRIRLLWRERVLIGLLVGSGVLLALLSDVFLTPANLLRATRYAAEIGLVALPMTMIIIRRGIDLSVASNMALSAMAMGLLWQRGLPIWPAVAIGVATGTLAGWLNGWVIARVRVPAIVVTLATLAVYRGIATGLSGGTGILGFPERFLALGAGTVAGVPIQTIIWIAGIAAGAVFLTRTAGGRDIYGIGHNETALRFSGIDGDRIVLGPYTASGVVSALAGVIYAVPGGTAKANAAAGYELTGITAVGFGGTRLTGGERPILGPMLPVLLSPLPHIMLHPRRA